MDIFRFSSTPFTREIKTEHRFTAQFIEDEIVRLKQTIEARQSAALVGPAGSGKSVVLRTLKDSLPEARHRVTYLKLADLSARDMCRQVAVGLGLTPAGNYPSLVRLLEERLRAGFEGQGLRQVLFFDDAHEMRPEALRLLRLLTSFDMDSKLIVSVILSGQLGLKKSLLAAELDDVRQRLNHCGELRLLSREESRSYVAHRVKVAGSVKVPFADDALDALYEITLGNMRAIDKMSFASLRLASAAGRETIGASDVAAARTGQWM